MVSLNRDTSSLKIINRINEAYAIIDEALWQAVKDSDHRKELATYNRARSILLSFTNLSTNLEKERNRVLSYCLMRIDNTLGILGDTEDTIVRATKALEIAELSEDVLQIARCHLALGFRLSTKGQMMEANEHFQKVFEITKDQDSEDMLQLLGWALIAKGNILMKEGSYSKSLRALEEAESILLNIHNFAGIARVNEIMACNYKQLDDYTNSNRREKKAIKFWNKAKTEKR